MDPTARFALALLLLLTIQVLLGGTVVFLVRRWNQVAPVWSWPRAIRSFALLALLVTVLSLIPTIGRYAAVVVSLVGLKRMSGLDVIPTFILSFCMGILVFAISAVISDQLQVDLLGLRD
jgi:hypothetical protein